MNEPTLQERYDHFKDNAQAFVDSMTVLVNAAARRGDDELASKLRTWALSPWEAALRDDASGDLWFTCEVCEKPIKDSADCMGSDDGCWFHVSCVEPRPLKPLLRNSRECRRVIVA
jgi:hypothetical protein